MRSSSSAALRTLVVILGLSLPVAAHSTQCPDRLPPLPPEIAQAKQEIIDIAQSNLDRWGDPEVQQRLDERARILEAWFVDNRPANELALTARSWKAVWYEDPAFIVDVPGLVETDRENTYQVVRDGFYYNIAKVDVGASEDPDERLSLATFLKGEFGIEDPAGPSTCGLPRRNVVHLEFTTTRLRFRWIPSFFPLPLYVELLDRDILPAITVPFPPGNRGELWNLFIDEDLRVSFGGDDDPDNGNAGLFILVSQDRTTP